MKRIAWFIVTVLAVITNPAQAQLQGEASTKYRLLVADVITTGLGDSGQGTVDIFSAYFQLQAPSAPIVWQPLLPIVPLFGAALEERLAKEALQIISNPIGADRSYIPGPFEGTGYCNAWGDPHFTGFGGERFDFHGQEGTRSYAYLSDAGFQLNCTLAPWPYHPVGKTCAAAGAVFENETLLFEAAGGPPVLNGQVLSEATRRTLRDGSFVFWDGNNRVSFTSREGYSGSITRADSFTLNVEIAAPAKGYSLDGVMPTGLCGDTADYDGVPRHAMNGVSFIFGSGILIGRPEEYEVAGPLSTTFALSAFADSGQAGTALSAVPALSPHAAAERLELFFSGLKEYLSSTAGATALIRQLLELEQSRLTAARSTAAGFYSTSDTRPLAYIAFDTQQTDKILAEVEHLQQRLVQEPEVVRREFVEQLVTPILENAASRAKAEAGISKIDPARPISAGAQGTAGFQIMADETELARIVAEIDHLDQHSAEEPSGSILNGLDAAVVQPAAEPVFLQWPGPAGFSTAGFSTVGFSTAGSGTGADAPIVTPDHELPFSVKRPGNIMVETPAPIMQPSTAPAFTQWPGAAPGAVYANPGFPGADSWVNTLALPR